jgi:acetolactate synthase-1/2/3 large subunit
MVLTGAEIVIRCLQEEKVEYVFGYPGGAVLYIYDELFKQDKVRHVLVRHEQAPSMPPTPMRVRPAASASPW